MASLSANLPAPKTFAPSREDVLSTLGFFFGDPAVPEKLKDYSEHHAMTYHFPDAFYGQNNKIRETLNNLILKSPQDWQTAVALPFVRIQGTTVEWDELRCKPLPLATLLSSPLPYHLLTSSLCPVRSRRPSAPARALRGYLAHADLAAPPAP